MKNKGGMFLFLIGILLFSNFVFAQELTNEQIVFAKGAIEQKAKDVAKQVEIYLEAYPNKNVADLMNDSKFLEIAVQPVGKTGYTAVTNYDTLVPIAHANPAIVGIELETLKDKLPGFWEIMSKTRGGVNAEGVYDWAEADGTITKKYMYIAVVDIKTAEGIGLHVAATTYLDEYEFFEIPLQTDYNFWIYIALAVIFLISVILGLAISKDQTQVRTFSIRKKLLLSFGFILLIFIVVSFLNYSFNVQREKMTTEISEVEAPLELIVEQIINYDSRLTELTSTALLYSYKREFEKIEIYEKEYNELGVKLDDLLKVQAVELIEKSERSEEDKIEVRNYLKKLDELNLKLVDLELMAFEVMKIDSEGASKLIVSRDYEKYKNELKETYTEWRELEMRITNSYREKILQDTAKINNLNLILSVLGILGGIIIAVFMSFSITGPLRKLYDSAEKLERGNFDLNIDIKSGDEFEELADVLNKASTALGRIDKEHKQLDSAKTEFLSITSHELRSPMTPMKAQLQMLLGDYFGKLNEKQKEALQIVERNTTRLDKIIVDFLEISRIEAARLKFDFKKVDLVKTINSIVEEMKGFMPEKKIKIEVEMEKFPIIEADSDRFGQVLRNLINNAIKFTPEKGVVKVKGKLSEGMILFSVSDSGIGIADKDQKRIFEPFYQVENMYQHKSGGTGLGLAICKGIVESQNGKIWMESKPNVGTTFYFTIPLKPVTEIKPIRILFSESGDRDKKIKNLFTKYLGPIGEKEFEIFEASKVLNEKNLLDYFKMLRDKKIINEIIFEEFKKEILYIFMGSFGKVESVSETKNLKLNTTLDSKRDGNKK